MSLISRILCPTDFSDAAQHAFHYSNRLAHQLGAEMILLYAFDRPAALTVTGQAMPADPHLREKLDAIHSDYADVPLERVLHVGAPGEVICWLAATRHCDLIVIGTHGRSGLKHLVLGSVAEYVVRHAHCPVMTLRMKRKDESPPKEPLVLPIPAPRLM